MRLNQEMFDQRREWTVKKHSAYDHVATGTIGPIRDGSGNILPNGKFPDMKAMTDYIHGHGLKAGIYSTPGVKTCQEWAGSYGHECADADQYAKWGFDLLKYDQCSGGAFLQRLRKTVPGFQTKDFWTPMANYLRSQNRDILFNLCQYGLDTPWKWAPGLGIQSWRTGGDLNHNVHNYFTNALRIATELRSYNQPGQWNDPDFMYIHRIRDVAKMAEPSVEIKLNTNQRYQYVTLWSIVCAPFFFSCDIENIDEFTVRLLGNADVLNINQDELGHTAEVIRNVDQKETVMLKKLADGSKALAVFNRDAQNEATITVNWEEIGGCCEPEVFDVWRQKSLGHWKGGISVQLSPNGVGLFIIKGFDEPGSVRKVISNERQ
jgi:alpha-galactosidase